MEQSIPATAQSGGGAAAAPEEKLSEELQYTGDSWRLALISRGLGAPRPPRGALGLDPPNPEVRTPRGTGGLFRRAARARGAEVAPKGEPVVATHGPPRGL